MISLYTFPLAGTRKRGETEAEDQRLEQELLADEKEKAEHNMLVDLGRNDIGKISRIGIGRGCEIYGDRKILPCHAHRIDRNRNDQRG